MGKIAYLGLDVHARQSVLGHMDESGTFKISAAFATTEQNIITALSRIRAHEKYLTLEEGTLAYWVAQVAAPYVKQVIICDPRENALIYKSTNKNDTFILFFMVSSFIIVPGWPDFPGDIRVE